MYKNVIRLTEPTSEPVTLTQAKEQLRIEDSFTMDDNLLNSFITVARGRCEEYCNRYFAESDFRVLFDSFGDDSALCLPFPDSTVNSVSYVDSNGDTQPYTDYIYDADFQEITPNSSFPSGSNVKIEITSGKSYERSNQAMLLYVADFYEVRTAENSEPNYAAEALLYPLRVEIGA